MASDRIKLRAMTFSGKASTRVNLYARPTLDKSERAEVRKLNGKSDYVPIANILEWEYLGYLIVPNDWSKGLDRRLSLSEVEQWSHSG